MPYAAIPPAAATLTGITGLTDKQVVFGSSTGAGTSSSDFTYDDSTNDLSISASESGGTVGMTLANSSNTASSATQLTVQVAGGTAANPSIKLSISGVKTYDWRIDNANSDRLDLFFDSTRVLSIKEDVNTLFHLTTALEELVLYENTTASLYTRFKFKASSRFFEIYTFGASYGSSPYFGLTGANSVACVSDAESIALGTTASKPVVLGTNNTERLRISGPGVLTVWDGGSFVFGSSTGVKLGAAADKIGFYNATPVVQQTRGATLTNSVTSGGTDDTIADFAASLYATDAATIRNDIYQLARIVRMHDVALRALGLET